MKEVGYMRIGEYDPFHEETLYATTLSILSKKYQEFNNRNPLIIKSNIDEIRSNLNQLDRYIDPTSRYKEERKNMIKRMKGLKTVSWELERYKRMPPWMITIVDSFLLEVATGDLYISTSVRNSCKYGGQDPKDFAFKTREIVEKCEKIPRACIIETNPIKRANMVFAYLELVQPILPHVIETEDYEILYKGHAEVLKSRFFPEIIQEKIIYRQPLIKTISNYINKHGPMQTSLVFSYCLHNILKDEIPKNLEEEVLVGVV
ncbi:MAG: hypothetical protein QXX38_01465 [Candidatus Aenigmatarchaeota archaeon]